MGKVKHKKCRKEGKAKAKAMAYMTFELEGAKLSVCSYFHVPF